MNNPSLFGKRAKPPDVMVNSIAGIRELVQRVRVNPYDKEARDVLADWCGEKAFEIASTVLRHDPDVETQAILSALQLLFGDVGATDKPLYGTGRYDAILGLPSIQINPLETVLLTGTAKVACRVRRMVLSGQSSELVTRDGVNSAYVSRVVPPELIHVHSARFGVTEFLLGSEVPGNLFQMEGPELFNNEILPGIPLVIVLENVSDQPLRAYVTLLGNLHA